MVVVLELGSKLCLMGCRSDRGNFLSVKKIHSKKLFRCLIATQTWYENGYDQGSQISHVPEVFFVVVVVLFSGLRRLLHSLVT